MKPVVLFASLTLLTAGGCSILPSAGPTASEVDAQRQTGEEIRFDRLSNREKGRWWAENCRKFKACGSHSAGQR